MAYLEELLPEFRKGAKIRCSDWDKERFIHYLNEVICDECDCPIFDEVADWTDILLSDKWEFYTELEPDFDYIIKNKCLCWFWDNKGDEKQIGYWVGINDKRFYLEAPEDCFNSYTYCRPVRKNEVTFYEDKE